MLRAFSMRSNQLGSRVVSDAGRKLMMMPAPAHQLAPSRHPLCTNASAENAAAPQDTTERMRQPYVPLYKGQQVMPHRQRCVLQAKGAPSRCQEWPIAAARMLLTSPMLLPSLLQLSEAISAAEGHIAGPGVFQLTVRGEPQAVSGGNGFVAASNTEQQQQQQQQQKGYFNFRHLLVCRVTEPRLPVPEKEIRASTDQCECLSSCMGYLRFGVRNDVTRPGEIALRAYDVLKEEAIKPAALPTVALTSVGAASHVQAFKVSAGCGVGKVPVRFTHDGACLQCGYGVRKGLHCCACLQGQLS
eukprot:1145905-Pelagomonas_calceolata.AAC.1